MYRSIDTCLMTGTGLLIPTREVVAQPNLSPVGLGLEWCRQQIQATAHYRWHAASMTTQWLSFDLPMRSMIMIFVITS